MSGHHLGLTLVLVFGAGTFGAQSSQQNREQDRLADTGTVLSEILNLPDNVPQRILDETECVVVIPSMTKVAIAFGGAYGQGAMVCRTGKAFDGSWGSPAMYAIEGGGDGLQLRAESVDVVLMVMNPRSVVALLDGQVKLGSAVSSAPGPQASQIDTSRDESMRADIFSYSRFRDRFDGISLDGSSLRPDDDATEQIYGRRTTAREVVTGTTVPVPLAGRALVDVLQKRAPRHQPGRAGLR